MSYEGADAQGEIPLEPSTDRIDGAAALDARSGRDISIAPLTSPATPMMPALVGDAWRA